MTTPTNLTAPITDVPGLKVAGAQSFGSPTAPANPTAATLTATGNIPARPSGLPQTPQLFRFFVTAAAAVVLTARVGPTATTGDVVETVDGYIQGDIIEIASKATLANTATVQTATGPTTLGVLATTANAFQTCQIQWNGTNWVRVGGSVPVA